MNFLLDALRSGLGRAPGLEGLLPPGAPNAPGAPPFPALSGSAASTLGEEPVPFSGPLHVRELPGVRTDSRLLELNTEPPDAHLLREGLRRYAASARTLAGSPGAQLAGVPLEQLAGRDDAPPDATLILEALRRLRQGGR